MFNIARIGDRCNGNCSIHGPQSGRIITGSEKNFYNDIPVARIGDKVLADCGHSGIIITGSEKNFSEGLNVARIGDRYSGIFSGVIISGSPNSFSE